MGLITKAEPTAAAGAGCGPVDGLEQNGAAEPRRSATMKMQHMKIVDGGLDDPRVQKLLAHHFASARAQTAPGSAHALDLDGLTCPGIRFWSAWDAETVIGIGAVKRLSESHGELKSMHTVEAYRRKGVGSAVLSHIIAEARTMGLSRLSLETGSWPYFAAARAFYARHGFADCPAFGDYIADPNSVFMTLRLNRGP